MVEPVNFAPTATFYADIEWFPQTGVSKLFDKLKARLQKQRIGKDQGKKGSGKAACS